MLCFNIFAIRTYDKQAGVISLPWDEILHALPLAGLFMLMYAVGRNRGKRAERRDMMRRTTQQAIIDTIIAFKERGRLVSIGDLMTAMPRWPHKLYPVIEHMLLTGRIIVTNPLHAENMEPRYFDLPAPEASVEEPTDTAVILHKEA